MGIKWENLLAVDPLKIDELFISQTNSNKA